MLNVLQGGQTSIRWQFAVVLANVLSSIFIAAALMMALETLGDPEARGPWLKVRSFARGVLSSTL